MSNTEFDCADHPAADSPVRFCPQCGTLLDIDTKAVCSRCKFQCVVQELGLARAEVTTFTSIRSASVLRDIERELQAETRAIVDETCPRCNFGQMYFSSAQLRSADEGETVFYECRKCHYRFSQNN